MDAKKTQFPHLSSPNANIKAHYDVVVVGSGYGGSIAACRIASTGKSVCVLERGKEWLPGEFPETILKASRDLQMHFAQNKFHSGEPYNLYEIYFGDNVSVLQGCGLGGGSLINASVALKAEPEIYEQDTWPATFRSDSQNLMEMDYHHVVDMLKPIPYPDSYPQLDKIQRMREGFSAFDIEDLDKHFYKTPIYVTFEDKEKNHVGAPQPKCTGCGNCCGGCNVGAKNTLNLNYLAGAKAYGAEIYTKVEVMAIARKQNTKEWLVHYKRLVKGNFNVEEQTISASHVILGAGALGSTKILLRSKNRGLNISSSIGKRFSTNGDMLGFSYDGNKVVNSIGVKTKDMIGSKSDNPPGPCITTVMDLRTNKELTKNYILEDGTPPSSIAFPHSLWLTAAAKLHYDLDLDKTNEAPPMKKSLAFLGMSNDKSRGQIMFHTNTDDISVSYENIRSESNFKEVVEGMKNVTKELGGKFVENPMYSKLLGRSIITVHPLGGCPMADSGQTGVVNNAGQVFDGDSDQVYKGLYVVDGAIIPTSVGVNPTLTIACVAERCVRLLAEREEWKINYKFRQLSENAFREQRIGISFTEMMVGKFTSSATKVEEACEFKLTIESNDLKRMLECDPDHVANISGTVTCHALASSPLTVSDGYFELFSPADDDSPTNESKQMVYKMILNDAKSNSTFSFYGVKHIHKDHFWNIGLRNTTELFVDIYIGDDFSGDLLGKAKLYITLPNFFKQLQTIEITHTQSVEENEVWLGKFVWFFVKTIWNVYRPRFLEHLLSRYDLAEPQTRVRRALKLNGAFPVLHEITTKDDFDILLTRYEGGRKGPVVMFHGAGVSSMIFSLDTIDTNLVEYLMNHDYDVWLVDWRVSCDLPLMAKREYTLDDCAKYDYPAAIDKILEITNKNKVQVVAHCAGSLVLFASLLSGALDGKVSNVIASQVAANPIPSKFNWYKSHLYFAEVGYTIGLKGLTVDTNENASFFNRMFNSVCKKIVHLAIEKSERIEDPVFDRITFLYGLLWESKNLNDLTLSSLNEFFGYLTSLVSCQLALTMRKEKLVSADGKDIYLPDSHIGLQSPEYKSHIGRLNLPIRFLAGEKNQCYLPKSTRTTFELVKKAHPHQNYSMITIPDYGHLDCIIGKHAASHVYPYILEALEQYSNN